MAQYRVVVEATVYIEADSEEEALDIAGDTVIEADEVTYIGKVE